MKVVCIVQARTGSTRLPNKILLKLFEKELLILELERVIESERIDHIVIATTDKEPDLIVEELIHSYNNPKVDTFRGSEDDVLDRYYQAAKKHRADVIVRITGDCPLIDWELIDKIIDEFLKGDYDYVSNILPTRTFPRGLDVEVLSFEVLEWMWKNCHKKSEREHVTTYIRENSEKYKIRNIENEIDLSNLRWTLDEQNDFELIEAIYKELYPQNKKFKTKDILKLLGKRPELSKLNEHVEQKKNLKNESN